MRNIYSYKSQKSDLFALITSDFEWNLNNVNVSGTKVSCLGSSLVVVVLTFLHEIIVTNIITILIFNLNLSLSELHLS